MSCDLFVMMELNGIMNFCGFACKKEKEKSKKGRKTHFLGKHDIVGHVLEDFGHKNHRTSSSSRDIHINDTKSFGSERHGTQKAKKEESSKNSRLQIRELFRDHPLHRMEDDSHTPIIPNPFISLSLRSGAVEQTYRGIVEANIRSIRSLENLAKTSMLASAELSEQRA